MPLSTYETDGYPDAPAVLRQVDVRIQQILVFQNPRVINKHKRRASGFGPVRSRHVASEHPRKLIT